MGTQIGAEFGSYSQGNPTAAYGTLVRELNGVFTAPGANGTFTAVSTGVRNLYCRDSNFADNTGSIPFTIAGVPAPATWALTILGVGAMGGAMRVRRRKLATA